MADSTGARLSLARIVARLRQPQWGIAFVTLVERLSAEGAVGFHAWGGRIALRGENRRHVPAPSGGIVSARACGDFGHSRRVANAASDRGDSKNEGLPHRLLRILASISSPRGLASPCHRR